MTLPTGSGTSSFEPLCRSETGPRSKRLRDRKSHRSGTSLGSRTLYNRVITDKRSRSLDDVSPATESSCTSRRANGSWPERNAFESGIEEDCCEFHRVASLKLGFAQRSRLVR